jgi:hypothetical protein
LINVSEVLTASTIRVMMEAGSNFYETTRRSSLEESIFILAAVRT